MWCQLPTGLHRHYGPLRIHYPLYFEGFNEFSRHPLWFYGTLPLPSAFRHQTGLSPDVNQAPFLDWLRWVIR